MMKYFFLIIAVFLTTVLCHAQEISGSMNYTHSGRNFALTYLHSIKKSEFGIGI